MHLKKIITLAIFSTPLFASALSLDVFEINLKDDNTGSITLINSDDTPQLVKLSADSDVMVFPKRVTLAPYEKQVVRVKVGDAFTAEKKYLRVSSLEIVMDNDGVVQEVIDQANRVNVGIPIRSQDS